MIYLLLILPWLILLLDIKIFIDLWAWYVVPLGVPIVTYQVGFGIFLMKNVLLDKVSSIDLFLSIKEPNDSQKISFLALASKVVASLIAWGLGYLVIK